MENFDFISWNEFVKDEEIRKNKNDKLKNLVSSFIKDMMKLEITLEDYNYIMSLINKNIKKTKLTM